MEEQGIDALMQQFRGAMGQLPTGVSVVIAEAEGDLRAMTVGSVVLASLDPPLVALFVGKDSPMHGHLLRAARFTISILEAGDFLAARRFARSGGLRGGGGLVAVEMVERDEGPPVLCRAVSWLDCEAAQSTPVGDHSCFIGRVLEVGRRPGVMPLVYYRGRFRGLGTEVSPGMRLMAELGELASSW